MDARDVTSSALVGRNRAAEAEIIVREEGVIAGLAVAEWTFSAADPRIRFRPAVRDGERVFPDKAVAYLEGPARGILAAERSALNFLARLSGIATLTRAFMEKVRGTRARIYDTRKTTPGLRALERYAVAAGGGVNHRMGLFDQVLIKENHLRLVAGELAVGRGRKPVGSSAIGEAVARARSRSPFKGLSPKGAVPVEVEVTGLREFRQALAARPEIILLDNMRLAEIREAVRLRDAVSRSRKSPRVLLEVSGGVTLENVRALAETGVERISVGALTHSAPALDVALEIIR